MTGNSLYTDQSYSKDKKHSKRFDTVIGKSRPFWSHNWHLLYFALAGFDVLTIVVSLIISHYNLQNYDQVVSYSTSLIKVQNQIAKVAKAAQQVNAPGNDVFESKDPSTERMRFKSAVNIFEESFQELIAIKKDLAEQKIREIHFNEEKVILNDISTAMNNMRSTATRIFDLFDQQRPQQAGKYMAEMDRQYAKLSSTILKLSSKERDSVSQALKEHRKKLNHTKTVELYFGILLLLAVFAITLFGKHLSSFVKISLASAKRNQEILDAVSKSAIMAFTDKKGKITEINKLFCDISGYTRDELVGKNHRIINSGAHTKEFFKDLWNTINSGKTWSGDIQNRKKNGETYYLRSVIAPLTNIHGSIEEFIAIRFDVTAQRQKEAELIEAQAMAKIGSWSYDLVTGAQTWSSEHYRIFEIEEPQPAEVLYKLYRERIHPEDLSELDAILDRSIKNGGSFKFDHRVCLDSGKRIKYVRGIGRVIKDAEGNPRLISGTCQDIY